MVACSKRLNQCGGGKGGSVFTCWIRRGGGGWGWRPWGWCDGAAYGVCVLWLLQWGPVAILVKHNFIRLWWLSENLHKVPVVRRANRTTNKKKHDSPLQGSSLPVVSNMLWVDRGLTLMRVHMGIPAACGCVAFKLALFFNCKHNHGH